MKRVRTILMAVTLVTALLLSLGAVVAASDVVSVGAKDFTEQLILGHLVAELLEVNGYSTSRTLGLGGDQLVFSGILRGDIDMWVSYTGTLWAVILGNPLEPGIDPAELYEKTKAALKEQHDIELLSPLGFNNTYVFAAPRSFVEKHQVSKVSDLIPLAPSLTLGGSLAFMGDRPEGIQGVERVYGMKFGRTRPIESGLMFQALQLGQVDLIVPFSTHGQIAAMDLVLLEDDRNLFPPYDAALLVRGELLRERPELREILEQLAGKLDDTTMARLNYEVDGHRKNPRAVAVDFLKEIGLWQD